MPISDKDAWNKFVDVYTAATDSYGKDIIKISRKIMQILDVNVDGGCGNDSPKPKDFHPKKIIKEAQKRLGMETVTHNSDIFIATLVIKCHSRGEEFRQLWNRYISKECQIKNEGKKANKNGDILNSSRFLLPY